MDLRRRAGQITTLDHHQQILRQHVEGAGSREKWQGCDRQNSIDNKDTLLVASGGRLIILHAITKDGLLSAKKPDSDEYIDVPYRAEGTVLSAMMIWQAGSTKGDYFL